MGTALLCFAAPAGAQDMPALPKGVRLVLSRCDMIVARKPLLDQLRIELLSTGVIEIDLVDPEKGTSRETPQAERIATVQVYFPECDDSAGLVNLRVSDRLTAKYVERSLLVSDIAKSVRPRAIALAIVELLRASWLELVLHDDQFEDGAAEVDVRARLVTRLKERTIEDEAPRESPAAQAAAIEAARRAQEERELDDRWGKARLEWLAGARIFPQGGAGDLSTIVSGSLALNRRMRLHIGGVAAGGGISDKDGDVNSFEGAGRVALGLGGGSSPEIEVAPCVEVGYGKLSGDIEDKGGTIAIGSIQAIMRTVVTKGVDALVGVQGGYVIAPLEVKRDGDLVGGIKGPMLGITAGLSGIL